MEEEKRRIHEIAAEIAERMEAMQYKPANIKIFLRMARYLEEYIRHETGEEFYSEELGAAFLADTIGFPAIDPKPLTQYEKARIRCVRRIGEFQLFGSITRVRLTPEKSITWGLEDVRIVEAYFSEMQTCDLSSETMRARHDHLRKLYLHMAYRSCSGIKDVSAPLISSFVNSLQGLSPRYIKNILVTVRNYFRFVYEKGYLLLDWSSAVPCVMAPQNKNVPALWSEDEIMALLNHVDRGSPAGKRDYAILLLVVQLGIRISDVADLRLDSLKWERKEISLIQHKTKGRVTLPLLDDVGWAIIEYIQHGRPKVDSPFVFISVNAPYEKLVSGSIASIIQRYMRIAGIHQQRAGITSGMHSLRHAVARRLLEQGTPLSTVADIMGHSSYSSTSPYLKVDIAALRECSLSLMEGRNG